MSLTFISLVLVWCGGGSVWRCPALLFRTRATHALSYNEPSDWVRVWPDKNQIAIIVPWNRKNCVAPPLMSDPTTPFPVTQPEEVSQKFEANNSISGGSVTVCCLNDTEGGEPIPNDKDWPPLGTWVMGCSLPCHVTPLCYANCRLLNYADEM